MTGVDESSTKINYGLVSRFSLSYVLKIRKQIHLLARQGRNGIAFWSFSVLLEKHVTAELEVPFIERVCV